MKPTISRSNSKLPIQPVIITNDTNFTPKITDQTIELKEDQIKSTDCLDLCGSICLYIAFSLNILIGAGGTALCSVYYSVGTTQNWKIGGIVMGIATCIATLIMIYISLFKRNIARPRSYKEKEIIIDDEYMSNEDIDQWITKTHSEIDFQDGMINQTKETTEQRRRDTASSPIPNPSYPPLVTFNNDAIFCVGCDRLHPSAHKCMYSIQRGNSSVSRIQYIPQEKPVPIQTDDHAKKKELTKTSFDQSIIQSVISETELDQTDEITLSQVPLPKAEVLLRKPQTKIMIVRVPKGAGQLVIQPKKPPTESL